MRFPRCNASMVLALVLIEAFVQTPCRAAPRGQDGASPSHASHRRTNSLVVCDDVREPTTLDPVDEFSARVHTIIQQIFDGLVAMTPEGNLAPGLARAWTRLDDRRICFELADDLRFHDGSALTSSDVAFSIQRYLAPDSPFPGKDYFSSIRQVEIIDRVRFTVHTHHPDGLLLQKLAFLRIFPKEMPRTGRGPAQNRLPIGSGPYQVEAWTPGHSIRLRASKWCRAEARPQIETLIFRFIPQDRQVQALIDEEVDLLTDVPGTATFRIRKHAHLSIEKAYCFFTYAGSMNNRKLPFASIDARRALNHSLNRNHLIRYEARGNGRILATNTMPGQFGHNPRLPSYRYDPDLARQLFRKAIPEGPIRIRALVKSPAHRIGSFLKASLAQVGVDMDVTVTSDAQQFEWLARGPWDLFIGSCPDPFCHASFIQSMGTYSKTPFSQVDDATYDRLFVRACQILDERRQSEAFQELDAYVHRESLNLFTYQKLKIYAHANGLRFVPFVSGMPHFNRTRWSSNATSPSPTRHPLEP